MHAVRTVLLEAGTCDPQTRCCCRAIARGAVAALAFCHERGVAHGSLGAASFLLSTFDDRRAAELIVKLDNFGFARMLRRPHAPEGEADEGAPPSREAARTQTGVWGAKHLQSQPGARLQPGYTWHCKHYADQKSARGEPGSARMRSGRCAADRLLPSASCR
jgi:serine/threonine protein kinase